MEQTKKKGEVDYFFLVGTSVGFMAGVLIANGNDLAPLLLVVFLISYSIYASRGTN